MIDSQPVDLVPKQRKSVCLLLRPQSLSVSSLRVAQQRMLVLESDIGADRTLG